MRAPARWSRRSAPRAGGLGGIEDFLHAYSLSTKEGLALMVLAEALLRVPDAATADRLIEDKLAAGRWLDGDVKSHGAAGLGFGLDARRRRPHHPSRRDAGDDPRRRSRGGSACRRCARRRARRCGSSARISCSARPSRKRSTRARGHAEFRYSFDMLGEGARTAADAEKYFDAYAAAIAAIGASAGNAPRCRRGPEFR